MSISRLALLGLGVFSIASVAALPETPYQALVRLERYADAVRLTCRDFALPCKGVRFFIDRNKDPQANYAETDQIGRLHINISAFRHESEDLPHQGWLGAIIGHELVHRTQGNFARIYAQVERIYGGNSYLVAAREMDAWGYMLQHARRFGLNCSMVRVIEFNREYFEWVVNHKGKVPDEEALPLDVKKFDRLQRQCDGWAVKPRRDS